MKTITEVHPENLEKFKEEKIDITSIEKMDNGNYKVEYSYTENNLKRA